MPDLTKTTACWPWSHAWSQWIPHTAEATKHSGGTAINITLSWQDRTCTKCGRMQQEKLPYFVDTKGPANV